MYGLNLKSTLLQGGGAVSSAETSHARTKGAGAAFSQKLQNSSNMASSQVLTENSSHRGQEKAQDEPAREV